MNGLGIIKGLGVTLKHFFSTYTAEKFGNKQLASKRGTIAAEGLFTVQYPEESVIIPEEFRVIPFLLYTLNENGERKYRCTACGICAKVCPTQCIWITRKKDAETGKPIAEARVEIDHLPISFEAFIEKAGHHRLSQGRAGDRPQLPGQADL